MKGNKDMKTITNTTYPAFALLAFACLALLPSALDVCQQGCDLNNDNTFLGDDALVSNTTGFGNTAIGARALSINTTGSGNTATGLSALFENTTGINNTANGVGALIRNTGGNDNMASGF